MTIYELLLNCNGIIDALQIVFPLRHAPLPFSVQVNMERKRQTLEIWVANKSADQNIHYVNSCINSSC